MTADKSPRILVIRRDNIGDLVCTTPLLRALRRRFDHGWIGVLANSYNAPVLAGNDDIDGVFIYTKAKHRRPGQSLAGVLWRRLLMLKALRDLQLDDVLIATTVPQPRSVRLAQWLKPRRIVGFGACPGIDLALPVDDGQRHEVEDVFRLASIYGIDGPPPACRVVATAGVDTGPGLTVAIHISARKPSQRWPVERFADLMQRLHRAVGARFVLLWAPGEEDNPRHPGDDGRATRLLEMLGANVPVLPARTESLADMMTALARCHAMVCADGGAMHVAAGLGLPIVCLFGRSSASRWHPWDVPYRLLQKESCDVGDIGVEEVVAAFRDIGNRTLAAAAPPA